MRIAAAAVGLCALVATPAAARIFYVVQSGNQSWTVMDAEGIEPIPGSAFRKTWAVRVQRNILSGDPPQPGYVRTLTEYDCGEHRTRWREFTAFSRSGATLVSKVNPNPEWGPADEASDTYAAFRVVCEGVGGGAVVSADSVAKVVIGLMAAWDPTPEALAAAAAAKQGVAKPPAAKPGPGKPNAASPATAKPAATKPAAKSAATTAAAPKPAAPAAKPAPAKAVPAKPKA